MGAFPGPDEDAPGVSGNMDCEGEGTFVLTDRPVLALVDISPTFGPVFKRERDRCIDVSGLSSSTSSYTSVSVNTPSGNNDEVLKEPGGEDRAKERERSC